MHVRRFAFILTCSLFVFFASAQEEGVTVREKFIETLKSYLGTPYRYGGLSSDGLDCSGLLCVSAQKSLDIKLPRTVSALQQFVTLIDTTVMLPGDLIFFRTVDSTVSHVGVYIGNGEFIHAASEGDQTGVIITALEKPYWRKAFAGVGRFIDDTDGVLYSQYIAERKKAQRWHRVGTWFSKTFDYELSLSPVFVCSVPVPEISFDGVHADAALRFDVSQFKLGVSAGFAVTQSAVTLPLRVFLGHRYVALYYGIAPGYSYTDSWEMPTETGLMFCTPETSLLGFSWSLIGSWGIRSAYSESFDFNDIYRNASLSVGLKVRL